MEKKHGPHRDRLPGGALSSDHKTLASPSQILLYIPRNFQGFRRPAHIPISKIVEEEVYAIVSHSSQNAYPGS